MVSPEASDGTPRGAPARKARKGRLKVTVDRDAKGPARGEHGERRLRAARQGWVRVAGQPAAGIRG